MTAIGAGALALTGVVGMAPSAAATIRAHRVVVHPAISRTTQSPNAASFGCQTAPINGSKGPRCYVPAQMQTAYGVTPLLNQGDNGAGRTIAIVDAFGSPSISDDLKFFDATFDLPKAHFRQIAPVGKPPKFDPNNDDQFGWAVETSLDVQWANAIAPGANLLLVIAPSDNDTDIFNATKYVIDNNLADVISQSFGEAESCVDPTLLAEQHALFSAAVAKGITLFASSGDSGAAQPGCDGTGALEAASSPASDPSVTGVGGTTLDADPSTGAYNSETAWTERQFGCNPPALASADVNCSGGGFSTAYATPAYQQGAVSNGHRGVPDVAYNAGLNGGVLVYLGFYNELAGFPSNTFFLVGGTSAGTPQWAGIAAIGDQFGGHRLGNINPSLYAVAASASQYRADLHDVTQGTNFVVEIHDGFSTTPGWDAVTGLGSPNAAALVPTLAGQH